MVKITIQVDGKEDRIIEGAGVVFAVPSGDKVNAGITGSFSMSSLVSSFNAIRKAVSTSLETHLPKYESEEM